MKVVVAVILALGSASAIGSGPYLPSGWRPQGPAFYLPSEVQKPIDNPLKETILTESEASGSEGLREYGPPREEPLDIVQTLPDVVTDQPFFVQQLNLEPVTSVTEVNEEKAAIVEAITETAVEAEAEVDARSQKLLIEAVAVPAAEEINVIPEAVDVQEIEPTTSLVLVPEAYQNIQEPIVEVTVVPDSLQYVAQEINGNTHIVAEKIQEEIETQTVQNAQQYQEASQITVEQNIATKIADVQNVASQVAVEQNIASENVDEQNVASQVAVEQNIASEIVDEQNIASQVAVEQNIASEIVDAQNIASQVAVEQNIASEIVDAQNIASQDAVEQNIAQEEIVEKAAPIIIEALENIVKENTEEVAETDAVANTNAALVNLETEIKSAQIQEFINTESVLKNQEGSESVQLPEGFLEYGPPGFTEYGPPKVDPLLRSDVESNEVRRRRFSPKFRSTKQLNH